MGTLFSIINIVIMLIFIIGLFIMAKNMYHSQNESLPL